MYTGNECHIQNSRNWSALYGEPPSMVEWGHDTTSSAIHASRHRDRLRRRASRHDRARSRPTGAGDDPAADGYHPHNPAHHAAGATRPESRNSIGPPSQDGPGRPLVPRAGPAGGVRGASPGTRATPYASAPTPTGSSSSARPPAGTAAPPWPTSRPPAWSAIRSSTYRR